MSSKTLELTSKLSNTKYKILSIQDDSKPIPFNFGVRKAKLIITHIEDIQNFVMNNL